MYFGDLPVSELLEILNYVFGGNTGGYRRNEI